MTPTTQVLLEVTPENQKLVFGGHTFEDGNHIVDSAVQPDSVIQAAWKSHFSR
jgi:hypothetical protein